MKHRSPSIVILGVFLAVSLASPVAFASTFPDWVTQAAAAPLPPLDTKDAKAVVLLEDKLLTVDLSGKTTLRFRQVIKILRPAGRHYAVPIAWSRKDRKLLSFHVWTIGPDGHQYTVSDKEIVERGAEEWGILYNDVRYKTASPPGADPGGIVAYEFDQETPIYSGEESLVFPESRPHRALRLRSRSARKLAAPRSLVQICEHPAHGDHTESPSLGAHQYPRSLTSMTCPWRPSKTRSPAAWSCITQPAHCPTANSSGLTLASGITQLAAPQTEAPAEIAGQSRQLVDPNADFMNRIQEVARFHAAEDSLRRHRDRHRRLHPHSAADDLSQSLRRLQGQGHAAHRHARRRRRSLHLGAWSTPVAA